MARNIFWKLQNVWSGANCFPRGLMNRRQSCKSKMILINRCLSKSCFSRRSIIPIKCLNKDQRWPLKVMLYKLPAVQSQNRILRSTASSGQQQRKHQSSTLLHLYVIDRFSSQMASNVKIVSMPLGHHVLWVQELRTALVCTYSKISV